MSPQNIPLHKVTDAGGWDAEDLLGRLLLVVRAAFLDTGFVPASSRRKPPRSPRHAGASAPAPPFSLRYTIPELQHLHGADAAVTSVRVQGDLVALCSHLAGDVGRSRTTHWACIDAPAVAAPLLAAGGLGAAESALASHRAGAELWRMLAKGLCWRLLADIRRKNGMPAFPGFMSLPGDMKAAVLAKVTSGRTLAMVECTCTELRSLVAGLDGDLWKAMHDKVARVRDAASRSTPFASVVARAWAWVLPKPKGATAMATAPSWKGRYLHCMVEIWRLPWSSYRHYVDDFVLLPIAARCKNYRRLDDARNDRSSLQDDPLEPTLRRRSLVGKSNVPVVAGGGHRGKAMADMRCRRRHSKGAILASSSRYQWMHR